MTHVLRLLLWLRRYTVVVVVVGVAVVVVSKDPHRRQSGQEKFFWRRCGCYSQIPEPRRRGGRKRKRKRPLNSPAATSRSGFCVGGGESAAGPAIGFPPYLFGWPTKCILGKVLDLYSIVGKLHAQNCSLDKSYSGCPGDE